jgi:hypothetical protein
MQTETNASISLQAGSDTQHIGFNDAREAFQRNSNWWTVFATFDLPDFTASPLWISGKTGLPVEEVVEALEGLSVLGYLKKENGSFMPMKDREFLKFDWSGKSKAEIIDEHAVVSQQILNDMHPNTTVAFDHRFLAGNKELIIELYKDIQAAFDKAFEKSQQQRASNDAIFKVTFTAVDVLQTQRPESGNGRGVK